MVLHHHTKDENGSWDEFSRRRKKEEKNLMSPFQENSETDRRADAQTDYKIIGQWHTL